MKNVGIYYTGGCGGHFIYYFLAASGKYEAWDSVYKINIGKPENIKKLKQQFYFQFNENIKWLEHEIWPLNKITSTHNQLFLFCNPKEDHLSEGMFNVDCIKICPYINNVNDWFRTILYKKTSIFRDENITVKLVKDHYKKTLDKTPILKIPNNDYYFDVIKFTQSKKERDKLCDFLQIPNNDVMEEFVAHYISLHSSLKKTSWVIDNSSKYVL